MVPFSTPFRYNSLPASAVYGYETGSSGAVDFTRLRRGETVADIVAMTLGEPVFLTATPG